MVVDRRIRDDMHWHQPARRVTIGRSVSRRGRAAKLTLPLVVRGRRHASLLADTSDAVPAVPPSFDQLPPKRRPIGIRPPPHCRAPCQTEDFNETLSLTGSARMWF